MRARFAVAENCQSPDQPDRSKVMHLTIYDGSQTDSAVARRSEANQIGLASKDALRNVVISHFTSEQGAGLTGAAEYD